jgi:hypothetical protein
VPWDHLKDVLAFPSGTLWTVGDMTEQDLAGDEGWALIQRRIRSAWTTFPIEHQAYEDTLESLSALSSRDIWTVGWAYDDAWGRTDALTFRWNGQRWSEVALPPRQDDDDSFALYGVESHSSTKTWAVGGEDLSGSLRAWVLRWNGTVWRTVSNPSAPDNSFLRDVTHVPNTEITWAVGGIFGGGFGVTTPLIQRHC